MILKVDSVTKRFGGLSALSNVTFELEEGMILGLIGPNGAGKTTLFNCITGLLPLTEGRVILKGQTISGKAPHEINKAGIARTFQIVKPFGNMTTLQNVMVGAFCRTNDYNKAYEEALHALQTVGLANKKDSVAKTINLGERKKLELARAIATKPEILLLDEVMAGLTPQELKDMVSIVKRINQSGVTIMVIEHIMEAIMNLSDHIIVLNFGQKIAEGTPLEVKNNPQVIEAYLGIEEEDHIA